MLLPSQIMVESSPVFDCVFSNNNQQHRQQCLAASTQNTPQHISEPVPRTSRTTAHLPRYAGQCGCAAAILLPSCCWCYPEMHASHIAQQNHAVQVSAPCGLALCCLALGGLCLVEGPLLLSRKDLVSSLLTCKWGTVRYNNTHAGLQLVGKEFMTCWRQGPKIGC